MMYMYICIYIYARACKSQENLDPMQLQADRRA